MYSKDILTVVLEKFHEIPFTNKKVACRRQAMQRVTIKSILRPAVTTFFPDINCCENNSRVGNNHHNLLASHSDQKKLHYLIIKLL